MTRHINTRILFVSILSLISINNDASNKVDSVLQVLDQTIKESSHYEKIREDRINQLKNDFYRSQSNLEKAYYINSQIINEYYAYICDSAITYQSKNIDIAFQLNDIHKEYDSKLQKAYLMASTGMYKESWDLLQTIDRSKLQESLMVDYYNAFVRLYGELHVYTQDSKSMKKYADNAKKYLDSLNQIIKPNSFKYLQNLEDSLRNTHNYEQALEINAQYLSQIKEGTPEYALATYYRAFTYQFEGNVDAQKYWLAVSAISDIKAAIKDQASIRILAGILYNEGDIDRAYNYIRFSWNATSFYNTKLRTLQTASVLSMIDKTYQVRIEKQKKKLQFYLVFISSLSILLIISIFIIIKQINSLVLAKKKLQQANEELNAMNHDLNQLNSEMSVVNSELNESNKIKEVYIGRFIELCSIYINKIDDFRRLVHNRIKSGNITDAQRLTQSQDIMDEEYAELYENFDNAFLELFPNFVDKVNNLLKEETKYILKKGELLNPELRIIALMRLGINDGANISRFLRYSLTTVYNYRTKIKNKTNLSKDEFDKKVLEIR
jgi:hypothetical protein